MRQIAELHNDEELNEMRHPHTSLSYQTPFCIFTAKCQGTSKVLPPQVSQPLRHRTHIFALQPPENLHFQYYFLKIVQLIFISFYDQQKYKTIKHSRFFDLYARSEVSFFTILLSGS
jgi:hypothetical protein